MTASTVEIMNKGMKCLTDNLGTIDAEMFISVIIRERFDYTKWQREFFDSMTDQEISDGALKFSTDNPYTGNATRL